MSTIRLKTSTITVTKTVIPTRTGRSSRIVALTSSVPIPGRPNTVSTKTALARKRPRSMPSIVMTGSATWRRTWWRITWNSEPPFARAVITWSSRSASIVNERIIRV
jgi:hypothetical protein